MAFWDIGLRHIVDVDGQLLAIDADLVDSRMLLAKADRSVDRQLWLNRAGERIALQAQQLIRLPTDEVLFFETAEACQDWHLTRLAA